MADKWAVGECPGMQEDPKVSWALPAHLEEAASPLQSAMGCESQPSRLCGLCYLLFFLDFFFFKLWFFACVFVFWYQGSNS